jgi:hypothetical protein
MPYNQNLMQHTSTTRVTSFVPRAALAMGTVGAVIGGTAAAAKNFRRVSEGEINREEAVKDTVKEAAGAGLATAAAGAVVGAMGATGFFAFLGVVAVATGTKYLWDSATTAEKITDRTSNAKALKKEAKSS